MIAQYDPLDPVSHRLNNALILPTPGKAVGNEY